MIQDSVNQMLGQAGIIGGYLGHMRTSNINSELEDKSKFFKEDIAEKAKEGNITGAQVSSKYAEDELSSLNKWTSPVQSLMKEKQLRDELGSFSAKQMNTASNTYVENRNEAKALKRALDSSNKARMSMVRASKLAQAKQEQANSNFTTNFGKSSELPPKMKEFVENEMKKGGNK